ncbi:hypothetical protein [Massilia genomosp. 1]|uniref:Curlin-associated protein n=1 Tax=Massilia genomosp. 1 TaxID=2609280 RepID=A0ABX0MKQ8_9BURK|nr:hypothetical protein [Massilia genomosp. 1]NHZ62921.1 hypothetical protein [Massilia genomosp. 1]
MKTFFAALAASTSLFFPAHPAHAERSAVATQSGNANSSLIRQDAETFTNAGVHQRGSANSGALMQDVVYYSVARLEQDGIANSARLAQSHTGHIHVSALQSGSANQADITQREGCHYSSARLTQIGTFHTASVQQHHYLALTQVRIAQSGHANRATASQFDSERTDLAVSQSGAGNSASSEQGGVQNNSTVVQNGTNNVAVQSQGVGGNELDIRQAGSNNKAGARQVGQAPYGDRFMAALAQTGVANSAGVHQY